MARIFDFLLELIKWPVAVLSVICLPAFIEALEYCDVRNMRFIVFLVGCFVYLGVKIVAGVRSNIFMQILAHELTHIFFALLTFHRVTHLHINYDETGGAMRFRGKGNWLITVSPYFFPLFLFFLMIGFTFFSDRLPSGYWVNGIIGYFFAYHLESMLVQIHGEQPDFKKAGVLFCIFLLPGANLFMCSLILAFNNGGFSNMEKYLTVVERLSSNSFSQIINYFTN